METGTHHDGSCGPEAALRQLLGVRVGAYLELVARIESSAVWDEDLVHDVRVAGRRLAAAIRSLKWAFPKRAMQLRRRVQAATRLLGELRDLDVLHGHVCQLTAGDPAPGAGRCASPAAAPPRDDLSACRAMIESLLSTRRQTMVRQARRRHGSRLGNGTAEALLELSKASREEEPGDARQSMERFHDRVMETVREFFRQAALTGPASGPGELHELRVAGKRMRYTLEIALCVYPGLETVLPSCQRLQGMLGKIHDLDVLREFVGEVPRLVSREAHQQAALEQCDELGRRCEEARARLAGDLHERWNEGAWEDLHDSVIGALAAH